MINRVLLHMRVPVIVLLLGILGWLPAKAQYSKPYLMRNAQTELLQNQFTQAILSLNRVIRYYPDDADAFLLRGIAKYELSDSRGAEEDFQRAFALDTFRTQALYYLTIIEIERSEIDKAMTHISKAIQLDDRYAEYFVSRGWLHAETGDTLAAYADYEHAISLNSKMVLAYINLSYLMADQKRFAESLDNCSRAIRLDPENDQWHLAEGNIYQQMEEFEKALEKYKFVYSRDSLNTRANFLIGVCYLEMDSFTLATERFSEVLEANSDNSVAEYYLGISYFENNRIRDAIFHFNRVLAMNPDNIYGYYARGLCWHVTGSYKKAIADFSKVIELYPQMPDAYRMRANNRLAINDLQGYLDDRSLGDTILARGIPDLSSSEYAYLRQITSFRTDFTHREQVANSKVQYADFQIDYLPQFILKLEKKQVTDRSSSHTDPRRVARIVETSGKVSINFAVDDAGSVSGTSDWRTALDSLSFTPVTREDSFVIQAVKLRSKMYHQEAIRLIEAYHEKNDESAFLYFIKGNCYSDLANIIYTIDKRDKPMIMTGTAPDSAMNPIVMDYYRKATEAYTRAIELSPTMIYANYNRARVQAIMNRWTEAILDFTFCIAYDEGFAEAYFNRGLLQLQYGNNSSACRDMSRAGELGIQNAYRIIYYSCK